jgi:hypothetical protein
VTVAATETSKLNTRGSRKRSAPKADAGKIVQKQGAASGAGHRVYSFTGEIGDLPTALKKTHVAKGYRTVVIAETHEAEDALRRVGGFREVRFAREALRNKASSKHRVFKIKGVGARKADLWDRMTVIEVSGPATDAFAAKAIAEDAFRPDARARALLRGKDFAEADLKAAGGAFDIEEVRKLLNGVTRQAVDKRINDGGLLAVPGPSGHRRFPTMQFNPDGSVVAGLKAALKALDFASPWAALNFLVNANDQLGGQTPIDALRQGAVERVVAAANSIGVQGA